MITIATCQKAKNSVSLLYQNCTLWACDIWQRAYFVKEQELSIIGEESRTQKPCPIRGGGQWTPSSFLQSFVFRGRLCRVQELPGWGAMWIRIGVRPMMRGIYIRYYIHVLTQRPVVPATFKRDQDEVWLLKRFKNHWTTIIWTLTSHIQPCCLFHYYLSFANSCHTCSLRESS